MDHFDDREWIDFARGTLETARRDELAAHLSSGCTSCVGDAAGWRNLVALAARTRQTVPEDAVQRVKAAYFLHDVPDVAPETVQFAAMVFDSLHSPMTAGARSDWFGPRHCVYESGGFTVEFHLAAGRENDRGFLTGLIADPLGKSSGLLGSRVKLVRGPSVTAQTTANAFGEFMLELTIHESQWMLVEIPETAPIAIPIPDSQP